MELLIVANKLEDRLLNAPAVPFTNQARIHETVLTRASARLARVAPRNDDGSIDAELGRAIERIAAAAQRAKPVPLTEQVRIDREEVFGALDAVRARAPEVWREHGGVSHRPVGEDPPVADALEEDSAASHRVKDYFTKSRSGRVLSGLFMIAMGYVGFVSLWVNPDQYFAEFGVISPIIFAVTSLFAWFGLRVLVEGLAGRPPRVLNVNSRTNARPTPGWWVGLAAMGLTVLLMIFVIRPALQSDRLLTGFEPDVAVAAGDPVLFVDTAGPVQLVGRVASTGTYERRGSREMRYIDLDFSDPNPALDDAEARVLPDAFTGRRRPIGPLLMQARIEPGPSGSAVFLVGPDLAEQLDELPAAEH